MNTELLHLSSGFQLNLFLLGIMLGAAFGLFYDFFRFLRFFFYSNSIVVFIEDILYSFICSVVSVLFIFIFNYGQVRIYIVLSIVFGIILYYFTIGKLSFFATRKITEKMKDIKHNIVKKYGGSALRRNKKDEV